LDVDVPCGRGGGEKPVLDYEAVNPIRYFPRGTKIGGSWTPVGKMVGRVVRRFDEGFTIGSAGTWLCGVSRPLSARVADPAVQ
jgi:hypothetical protein